jgi:hydrogenase expression/formation protein HypC
MCLAIPGQIVQIPLGETWAVADVVGMRRRVDLGLLQEDRPVLGDWVLIHVGFAMSKISEADAKDQLRALEALGESAAVLEEVRGYELGEENHLLDENGSPGTASGTANPAASPMLSPIQSDELAAAPHKQPGDSQ